MKKRMTALLLSVAIALALGVPAALAEGGEPAAAETSGMIDAAEEAGAESETKSEAEQEPEPEAEPEAEALPAEESVGEEEEEPSSGPSVTLTFASLETAIRENYYPVLALEENIKGLSELSYRQMESDLRDSLDAISEQEWMVMQAMEMGMEPLYTQSALITLEQNYDALEKQYDEIRSGKLRADNEAVIRQLRNVQDQTVIVGESLYISLSGLRAQDAALTRRIAALERTEREMTLRHELGQVSALAVQQVNAGLAQAKSGQRTLRMNMENLALQLKAMTGEDLDASLLLTPLPVVTAEQLASMDLTADLAAGKDASYELFDARKKVSDAKEKLEDVKNGSSNEITTARHSHESAKLTEADAQQNFELKFRTLYAQVKDAAQVLRTARTALAAEESNYAASALKYEQGNLSANALADAKDKLAEAKDSIADAERELFSKYRSYEWAVEYGILNG